MPSANKTSKVKLQQKLLKQKRAFLLALGCLALIAFGIWLYRGTYIEKIELKNEYFIDSTQYKAVFQIAEKAMKGNNFYYGKSILQQQLERSEIVDISNLKISRSDSNSNTAIIYLSAPQNLVAVFRDGRFLTSGNKSLRLDLEKPISATMLSFDSILSENDKSTRMVFFTLRELFKKHNLQIVTLFNGSFSIDIDVKEDINKSITQNMSSVDKKRIIQKSVKSMKILLKGLENSYFFSNNNIGNSSNISTLEKQKRDLEYILNSQFFKDEKSHIKTLDFRYKKGVAVQMDGAGLWRIHLKKKNI